MESPNYPLLSRRHLKCFASGIAFQFSASAQHYAWLAHAHRSPRVHIDLLHLAIEPEVFDIERNRILAGYCRDTLLKSIQRLKPPGGVNAATLIAEFGIDDYQEKGRYGSIGASVFTVTLVDDRGKPWSCAIHDERVLAQG